MPYDTGGFTFSDLFYNSYPQAGFAKWLQQLPQAYAFQNWLGGQYSKLYSRYAAQQPENPNLTWVGWLTNQNPIQSYQAIGYRERGENPSRFAPRVRFVGF